MELEMLENISGYFFIYIIPSLLTCFTTVGIFYLQLKRDRLKQAENDQLQHQKEEENKVYHQLIDNRPYIIIDKPINASNDCSTLELERFLLLKAESNNFKMELATEQRDIIMGLTNVGNGPALKLTFSKETSDYIFGGFDDRKIGEDIYYSSSISIPPNNKRNLHINLKYQPEAEKIKFGLISVDIEYCDLLNNKIILPLTLLITSGSINGYGDTVYESEELNRLLRIKNQSL